MKRGEGDVSFDDTVAPPSNPALDKTAASDPALDRTAASAPQLAQGSLPVGSAVAPGAAGDKIGRYIVTSQLGAGGMGVVLAAYDPELDRKVAIKLVRPGGVADPEGLRARMVREAQAMARLQHPNVLAVHDVGTVGSDVFVAMELVDGTTLGAWLATPRSRREVLRVFDQAGRGLAAAHAAGLVHRDFKPDNVMIGKDGRVRVMDFGLARQSERTEGKPEEPSAGQRPSALSLELTHAGALLGTPVYMAPEQWAGRPADARSDQYAFCVALWEALYGKRPFNAITLEALQRQVTGEQPVAPAEIKLSRRLGGALRRGLAKDPAERFPTMEALLDELAAEPLARRRLALAGGAVGLLAAGGIATALLVGRGEPAAEDKGAACDDAQIQLAGAWDVPRHTAVKNAVLGTKLPIAAQTWERLGGQLDARAADYMRVFAPTCRGAYRVPPHLRAAQTACLERRKAELGAFTGVLADLKPKELEHVVEASWGLASAKDCDDQAVLAAVTPPPADPKLAKQVEELHGDLERAHAIALAGRGKQALALAESVLARAQKLDYPPLAGEAKLLVGGLVAGGGDAKRGEALLGEAYTTLLAAGNDRGAAGAATRLAKLIGYDKQRPAASQQWLDQATALIKRVGTPADLELERLSAAGMMRYAVGDFAGAEPLFRQALALGTKALPPDDPRHATELNNLAGVLMEKDDLAGAVAMSKQALELTKRTLGPDHPDVGMALANLGMIQGELGQLAESEATERAALALREKVLGPEHPDIVITLFNLGAALFKEEKFAEAKTVAERALALSRKLNGEDHPDTADALENLADALEHTDDLAGARTSYAQVLAIRTRILEPGHPDIKRAADNVARMKRAKPRHR
jgi:eukaryotic-like serine/threonine-protein kinase